MRHVVCAEVRNDRCRIEEFLELLATSNLNAYDRLIAAMEQLANDGHLQLPKQVSKPLGDGLFELRDVESLARLIFFYDPAKRGYVIVATAFEKNPGRGSSSKQQQMKIREARKYFSDFRRHPDEFELEP